MDTERQRQEAAAAVAATRGQGQGGVDLSQISWKDTDFLQQFGLGPHNVLDYFGRSPFYDPASIPEQLKMQARFTEHLSEGAMDRSQMAGIDYVATPLSEQPSLFVVTSIVRRKARQPDVSQGFYILEGTIYKSPDLFTLLGSRLFSSMQLAGDALALGSMGAEFTLERGHLWKQEFDSGNDDDGDNNGNSKTVDIAVDDGVEGAKTDDNSTISNEGEEEDKFDVKRAKNGKEDTQNTDPTEGNNEDEDEDDSGEEDVKGLVLGSTPADTHHAGIMSQVVDNALRGVLDRTMKGFV